MQFRKKQTLLFMFFFLLTSQMLFAQLSQKLDLKLENVTLKDFFTAIENKTEYTFMYKNLDLKAPVTINAEQVELDQILIQVLRPQSIGYEISGKRIILKDIRNISQSDEKRTITGTITDIYGEPLIGANVIEKGTANGVLTDIEGNYVISVSPDAIIQISYIGFIPQEHSTRNKSNISLVLLEDAKTLDEVIVVGYGTQKKINLTGAVSQIDSKTLDSRPLTNLGQGLQGVIPNLVITTDDGRPGTGSSYNVRGYNSLNGGNPLILVDGVQMDPNQINPNDVETVTVLKDASSAAIYGGRAAYGVILITTKQGKKNTPMRINYSYDYTLTRPVRLPNIVNSLDYITMYREADNNGRISGGSTGSDVFTDLDVEKIKAYMQNPIPENSVYVDPNDPRRYRYVGNTNWTKEMYPGWAPQQQHNLSLNGGSEKTTYLASVGYLNQKGLLPSYANQRYERYNATLSMKTEINNWLEVSFRSMLNRKESNQPIKLFGTTSIDTFSGDLRPMMSVYHPDGNFSGQFGQTNPLAVVALGGRDKFTSDDIWLIGGVTIKPMKNVSVVADYTWNSYHYNNKVNQKEFDQYAAVPEGEDVTDPNLSLPTGKYPHTIPARVTESNSHDIYQAFNVYAQYENTFLKSHYIKAMIGYNQESKHVESFNASVKNLINQDYPYLNLNNDDKPNVGSGIGEWALIGTFFRLNYAFQEKYLFEFNGRYDGSSRFHKDNRYVFSPSFSAGWRISEEKFFKPLTSVISNLKLRLSYGKLPNQQLNDNYPYIASMGYGRTGYIFGSEQQVYVTSPNLVSPNFSWETVTSKNVGLDWSLFNNRLTGSFDYYIRDTKGMIVNGVILPSILGTGSPKRNAADLRTKGFEFEMMWRDKIGNKLNYYVGLNLSDNSAEITKYDLNPTGSINDHYVGKKIGEIWGLVTDGYYKTDEEAAGVDNSKIWGGKWLAGDIKYKNLNGDKTDDGKDIIDFGDSTLENPGDRKIIGNNQARYLYGIRLGADYNNFDFSMLMQGVGKRDVMLEGVYFWGFTSEWSVPTTEQLNYWTPERTDAYFPRLRFGGGGNFQTQTKYLQNGAYLRMKQLTIGYTAPRTLTQKINISKVRVYFTGQNLFEFSKIIKSYDPEQTNRLAYPINRAFSFGIQVEL